MGLARFISYCRSISEEGISWCHHTRGKIYWSFLSFVAIFESSSAFMEINRKHTLNLAALLFFFNFYFFYVSLMKELQVCKAGLVFSSY